MTITISQLANLSAVLGNVYIPMVSNVAGTLTTVKGNVEQLQTYVLGTIPTDLANTEANVSSLQSNVSTAQADIIALQAADVDDQANISVLQGNVADLKSNVSTLQSDVSNITDGTATFGNLIPTANITYSLGDSSNWWKDLYLSGNTLFIGGTSLSVDATGAISSPVTRELYSESFLPGTADSADTYTLSYLQTPGSTVTVVVVGEQGISPPSPAPSYVLTEGSDFTISGLTLTVTASYTATSITCYETYVDTGDLITATEIATEIVTPPSGDLTVDGNLVIVGDLTVSPASIYMGNLRISAADGNLTVNTGIKFDDDTVQSTAYTGDYNDLTNTPVLANVATSGDYNDLINAPSLTGNVTANYAVISGDPVTGQNALLVGVPGYIPFGNAIATFHGNIDSPMLVNIHNKNTGNSSTAGIVITADIGDPFNISTILGIASSNFTGLQPLVQPGDGFLQTVGGGNLVIGSEQSVTFYTDNLYETLSIIADGPGGATGNVKIAGNVNLKFVDANSAVYFGDGTVQTTAYTGDYTMGNSAHWTSNVTTIAAALDQLAERIYNIENP